MDIRTVMLVAVAFGFAGCAEKEQPVPEVVTEPKAVVDVESIAPEESAAPIEVADVADETMAVVQDWRTAELIDHMHAHAEHLDDISYALDDDNLEGARSAAQWFAQHKVVADLPAELEPFVAGMREAASTVEAATDLDAARLAAGEIGAQCRACHDAEGIATQ